MPATNLLDRLRESELLEPAVVEELARTPGARDADPRALGKTILKKGLLSRFQVNLIAQGRAKELTVGPYLLLDKLGEGGMGTVYKARHRHMNRVVALKLIRKEKLAKESAVKRFYREVQTASRLHHPNIVMAFDAGLANGTHYLAMELVDGIDLSRHVHEGGPLPVAAACEYIRQAALGLQHAHEKGLVHRDVKPHNLMLTSGEGGAELVKVLDLGLARLQGQGQEQANLTGSEQVLGTPNFLAPEQAFDSRTADGRADVYGLGCTLYFLLTGRPPFAGESVTQVLLMHQMEAPPTLGAVRPEVPPALQRVLERMMAKKPEDRFQTPAEVAEALTPLARGERGPAPPPVPRKKAERGGETWASLDESEGIVVKPSRSATELQEESSPRRSRKGEGADRTRFYALLAVGVGVPVVGLVVALALVLGGPRKPKPVAKVEPPPKVEPIVKPPEVKPPVVVEQPRPKEGPAAGPVSKQVDVPFLSVMAVPTRGKYLATGGPRLQVYDTEKEELSPPLPGVDGAVHRLAFAGDGVHLLGSGNDGRLRLWNAETRELVRTFDEGHVARFGVTGLDLSPDGRFAVSAGGILDADGKTERRGILLWDATTGKRLRRLEGNDSPNQALRFVADGKQVVSFESPNPRLHVHDVAGGKVKSLPVPFMAMSNFSVSRDGKRLMCSGGQSLIVWDLDKDRATHDINASSPNTTIRDAGFCADERYALTGSESSGEKNADGAVRFRNCWVRVWDVDARNVSSTMTGHKNQIKGVFCSPDGRRAYSYALGEGAFRVWDIAQGKAGIRK